MPVRQGVGRFQMDWTLAKTPGMTQDTLLALVSRARHGAQARLVLLRYFVLITSGAVPCRRLSQLYQGLVLQYKASSCSHRRHQLHASLPPLHLALGLCPDLGDLGGPARPVSKGAVHK
ncbi:unnamed protein product [Lampetra fluviatilis]